MLYSSASLNYDRKLRSLWREKAEFKCPKWVRDLAFLVDITQHLNILNKVLQGNRMLVAEYYDSLRAFKLKLSLWQTQLGNGDISLFPFLAAMHATEHDAGLNQCNDKITELLQEFERRFQVFTQLENEFTIFTSPFTVNATDMPADMQLELLDLQCDSTSKKNFASEGLDTFYQYLLPVYPRLTTLATNVLSMFKTIYLCDQAFSVMSLNRTKHRARLKNALLNDILKCVTTQF